MRTLVRASSSFVSPLIAVAALVSACSTTPAEPSPPVESPSPVVAAPTGRYAFVLRESDVLPKIEARCKATADAAACLKDIEGQAAREGIRLSLDPTGHLVWTSYGLEPDGSETVFLEATLDPRGMRPM